MDGSTKWIKTTVKYMSKTGIHFGKLRTESKADVKNSRTVGTNSYG